MSDRPVRECGRCGEPYDPETRGVSGRFHLAVIHATDRHGLVQLVGHWRAGALPENGRFVSGEAHFHAEVQIPDGDLARQRGQMSLTVLDGTPPTSDACVWGDE